MDSLFFRLYSDCIPVKGAKESIICDLLHEKYFSIPNLFYEVLDANSKFGFDISSLKKHFKNTISEGIDAYFDFFEEKQLGFFTTLPEVFQDIDFSFYSPFYISNSIIEISDKSKYDCIDAMNQFENLGCEAIELRFKNGYLIEDIENILSQFDESRIKCFNLLITFYLEISHEKVFKLLSSVQRVNTIIIHSCSDEIIKHNSDNKSIIYLKEKLSDLASMSKRKIKFITNLRTFSEAQNFNLGLNKKICIDEFGNLKNYISHENSYGNINSCLITELIDDTSFNKIWSINNDRIEKCKDCQYRYVCFSTSDIVYKNNKFYKHEICKFNPYTNLFTN